MMTLMVMSQTLPLTALLKKNVPFRWSDAANAAFVDLKSRLAFRPILSPPNYDLPFSVAVDASETCLGAVLFRVVDNVEHPINCLSRKLYYYSHSNYYCYHYYYHYNSHYCYYYYYYYYYCYSKKFEHMQGHTEMQI